MGTVYNKKDMNLARRLLRNKTTPHEKMLWHKLKGKQLEGFKFRRQFSVGYYVVDFYCPEKKLAIELDGSQHAEENTKKYDKERTKYLESLGIKVIRFWNSELDNNPEGVAAMIRKSLVD